MFPLFARPLGHTFVPALLLACGLPTLSSRVVAASAPHSDSVAWSRVHIEQAVPRLAVVSSLNGASLWLEDPGCQSLVVEFRDARQLPLANRLAELGVNWNEYLRLILFRDGSGLPQCNAQTVAFTAPGSRVVFICLQQFEGMWFKDPRRAIAIIIHEALHTLGLGENPPSSDQITSRVLALCKPSTQRRRAGSQHLR